MDESFEADVMKFLHARLEPFQLSELATHLRIKPTKQNVKDLAGYLISNTIAYVFPIENDLKEYWISRAGMMHHKSMPIRLSRFEIAAGVFIPGSRLLPFYNGTKAPHEFTFSFEESPLPRKQIKVSIAQAYEYYRLFGEEYVPQYLALDNEENAEIFSNYEAEEPQHITITVVDLRSLLWGTSYSLGDIILARVEDWDVASFSLHILPASAISKNAEQEWLEIFEESMIHALEITGPSSSIDEQLSLAWFIGGEVLFVNEAVPIADFLEWSKKIAVEPYGVETRLWYAGTEIPASKNWNLTLISLPGSLIEEIFIHLNLPLTEHLLDSYVLDALFQKETSIENLLSRVVPKKFCDSSFCLPLIRRTISLRYKLLAIDYNWFADHERGVLRNRYVVLHTAIMNFMLQLDSYAISPDSIANQGSVVLGQLLAHDVAALETIDFVALEETLDYESFWSSIEGMEDTFFETRTAIIEDLPELLKRRFSVINGKGSLF